MTFLAVISSPLPSPHIVYLVFFLNSATKKVNLGRVSNPLEGVTRGDPLPLVASLCKFRALKVLENEGGR